MRLSVLTGAHVRACVDMATAIDLMEEAFAALSDGRAVVPVRTSLEIPGGVTLVMPGSLRGGEKGTPGGEATAGAKIVSVVEANAQRGLPAVHAAVLLVDPTTGAPSALMDGTLVARSTVVVDSREAARAEAGDLAGAVRDGSVRGDPVAAELGDIVLGRHPGRRSADEITLFESLGSAAQDLVVAAYVLDVARSRGMGTIVDL